VSEVQQINAMHVRAFMSALPESLRRVLAAQKLKVSTPRHETSKNEVTIIWRDGEVLKQSPCGKIRQLKSIKPIL